MATPRLYLHIGLQKTGTSYLQRIFWDSVPALAAQGVDLVPDSKRAMFRLMLDARERFDPTIDQPSVSRAVDRLPAQLQQARDTALISQESLATATTPQIRRLLAATANREVHVVVTMRDLGRQIPSAWQQTLQNGKSRRFEAYVRNLESQAGQDAQVWATMDGPRILKRWGREVPPERIHVVTVPPSGSEPRLLLDRFCSVVGMSPESLTIDETSRGNRGLRAEQAEVLRRVNELLPPEFMRRDVYGDLGKRYFAVKVLGDDQGTRIQLPASRQAWCTDISQQYVEHIEGAGYQVAGDLGDLLPSPASFADEAVRVSHREVAALSSRALADMLVDRMEEREARRAARATPPPSPGPAGHAADLLRRAAHRVRPGRDRPAQ